MVAGHDRGGRVAYRLALDHPEVVAALIPVDIIPTAEVWRRITAQSAVRGYHWQFLAQPFPLPETLIGKDPVYYLEHTLMSWAGPRDLSPFSPEAMVHYRAQMQDPARVHAFCEDYRAGASVDRSLDEADVAAGHNIACPTLLLHGSYLPTGPAGTPLDIWRAWCTNVSAATVASGHFLAEENPKDTLAALIPFLAANSGAS
jgi:haloacetate dehalogenase